MSELYNNWLEGDISQIEQHKDPFWDPVEDIFLGRFASMKK